jgi:signal peptidase II
MSLPMSREQTRRFAIACLAAGVVVLIDQATKAAAIGGLSQTERIPLLGDLLGLQLAFNPGAILSLGAGFTGLLTLLGVGAVVVLVVAAARARTGIWAAGIGLILGGAVGNLIDRLFSPPGFGVGHVTDFLAYGNLFIGNLADVALGAGVIVLGLSLWARHRRARASATTGASPAAGSVVSGS